MKDIQGIQRGRCNSPGCECEEYRTSPTGESSGASGRFRCEYCDHTPVQHVKIIELGACKACGKDNCEKYEFDDPNCYSNCAYCDCPASSHEGAEKLRKPQPQQQGGASTMVGQQASMMSGMAAASGGFQPRMDARGQPTQAIQMGTCKFPGCPYPKRLEGNKVHDFCSRTCAKKFQSQVGPGTQFIGGHGGMSGGSHGPGHMTGQGPQSSNAMMTSSGGPVSGGGGGGGGMSSGGGSGGSGPATAAIATYRQVVVVSKGPAGQAPSQSQTAATCKNCGIRSANTGHSWCQICYQQKS